MSKQSSSNEDNTSTPLEENTFLKLVVSNPKPLQKLSLSQEKGIDKCAATSFMCEVHSKGPCLYEMVLKDPYYFLVCDLILEVEESRDRDEGKRVICHFPTLSGEELNDFVGSDATLYSAFMIQFQMKILEQLFLFCATHYASTLIIYADDSQAEALEVYNDFLSYKDETLTSKGEKAEMVIPADSETLAAWVEFMQVITTDFRQAFWRDQSSNPIIRQYLKDHPLG